MEAVADLSLMSADIANPFDDINPYLANIYSPNEALYNALYRAEAALETASMPFRMDVSLFSEIET